MTAALVLCCLTAADLPLVFLSPVDLTGANGVEVVAQVPAPGLQLLASEQRPALWYAPAAAFDDGGAVRIWYQRVCKGETDYSDQRTLCVGELRGGAWSLPALDPAPPAWGGPNNVVMRRSPHKPTWGGFNVFQIVRAAPGYRMLYWDQPEPPAEAGAMIAESKDGIHWNKRAGTVFVEHNDAYSLIEKDGAYVLYQTALEPWPDKPYPDNIDKFKRVLSVRTSPDLVTWTPQEAFLRPDAGDAPETEFYLLKVFAYRGGYAGLVMKYYGDPNAPNKHSAILKHELIVSGDARTWQRPFRATDIGFFSYADPFESGGAMHFAIWKDGGMNTVAYRKDGLTAAVAATSGSFTTRAFAMPANGIALNADTREGFIEAQLVDALGAPIDSVAARVGGQDGTALPLPLSVETTKKYAGQPCALRIRMERATLYAIAPAP